MTELSRRLLALSVIALLAAGCGAATREAPADTVEQPSGADAHSETVTSGKVRATLVYSVPPGEAYYVARLVAERLGKRVLDEIVPPYSGEFAGTKPVPVNGEKAITLRDLDGDEEPEIVVDLFWGGVHCCWWSRIYRWDAKAGEYRSLAKLWGNFDYRLADLDRDGRAEFASADNRFAYEFTSFAGSSFPLQIWTYEGGKLLDTTREYPALVAKDAQQEWQWYRDELKRSDEIRQMRGFLAAWAADECLLDRCDEAFATLHESSSDWANESWESDSAAEYLKHLHAFLERTGYLRPAPVSD